MFVRIINRFVFFDLSELSIRRNQVIDLDVGDLSPIAARMRAPFQEII